VSAWFQVTNDLEDILPRHHSGASDIEAVNKIYPAEGIVWSFSRNMPMAVFAVNSNANTHSLF
jgi:hypothetical protein